MYQYSFIAPYFSIILCIDALNLFQLAETHRNKQNRHRPPQFYPQHPQQLIQQVQSRIPVRPQSSIDVVRSHSRIHTLFQQPGAHDQ